MIGDRSVVDYYQKRAAQGDNTYGPSEIQSDLAWTTHWLQQNVAGRDVLEVACGTGHWTRIASSTARRMVASDMGWDVVYAARQKTSSPIVEFVVADAYTLPITRNAFDCGMAHFWLSHVSRLDIRPFISDLCAHLKPGSRLLITDTKWVEGYRKPTVRRDEVGDTYDVRTLKDGSRYEILKNYYNKDEWTSYLESFGTVHVEELKYIWAIRLELRSS
jgi:ubiquinone/menaquinone biosynthesis C-methylase UbiE